MISVALSPAGFAPHLLRLTQEYLGIQSGSYTYMPSLRQLDHSPSLQPPGIDWPPYISPIRVAPLAFYLRGHPDQEFAAFILRGLAVGFHVGYLAQGSRLQSSSRNHPSSLANSQVVQSYIRGEVLASRMVGPLPQGSVQAVHCSPVGLVPKARGSGQWRMIVDLSYPNGRSVNDGILSSLCSVSYAALDAALRFIKQLGRNTMLIKVDLRNAYRLVPIHPQDRHLFGVRWDDQVFVDQALPFGLSSAPKLFTAVADAIGWALLQSGLLFHIHYLDDFLFFFPSSAFQEPSPLPRILSILSTLNVPVALHKIEGPASTVTFLGVVVDTARFELRLPLDKLTHLQDLVRAWRGKRSGSFKGFESLLGHLSHAATVIRQGRIFLRHLFSILKSTRSSRHFVHLDTTARADLLWWEFFLEQWNGLMFFQAAPIPSSHIFTDASGSFGCGGVLMPSAWFQLRWPESWSEVDIVVKELVPIVVAAAIWGRHWSRSHVCFHSDNMAVVAILQSSSPRGELVLHLIRCLYFYAAIYQFDYSAEHVPGVLNVAADALSRNNFVLFSSLLPQASQCHIPTQLTELLINQHPDWGSQQWTALFVASLHSP